MNIVARSETDTRADQPLSGVCGVCGQTIFGCAWLRAHGTPTHFGCLPTPNAKWVELLGEEARAA